jgi:hypothetical protein
MVNTPPVLDTQLDCSAVTHARDMKLIMVINYFSSSLNIHEIEKCLKRFVYRNCMPVSIWILCNIVISISEINVVLKTSQTDLYRG